MEQKTDSWHAWRAKGIGSSDAPVIMGVSPWSTPFKLWEEKTGRKKYDQSNFATERGSRLEPKARAWYELHTDRTMDPVLAEHREYPFVRASLDGHSPNERGLLEIKCPVGRKDHDTRALPDKYVPQVQHQLLVTGYDWLDYLSYFEDDKTGQVDAYIIRVMPDIEYQKRLLAAEIAFWECVASGTPPAYSPADKVPVGDPELQQMLREWKAARTSVDALVTFLSETRAEIDKRFKDTRGTYGGVRLTRSKTGALTIALEKGSEDAGA
jgi:putative phage-type endonuclease